MIGLTGTSTTEVLEHDAFLYFLAKELGKTVAELVATLSHIEYLGWSAYYTAYHAINSKHNVSSAIV